MKLQITAMPSICDSEDFGLSEESTNKSIAKDLLSGP